MTMTLYSSDLAESVVSNNCSIVLRTLENGSAVIYILLFLFPGTIADTSTSSTKRQDLNHSLLPVVEGTVM